MSSDLSPAPAAPAPDAGSSRRQTWLVVAAVWLVLCAIFATARRPPILDLPQQLEQATLFDRWRAGDETLEVDFVGPNKLGLGIAMVVAHVTPMEWAPRAVVMAIAAVWCFSIGWIAVARDRDPWCAALACCCLLSNPFYAGFLNFLSGIFALAFWSWELRKAPEGGPFLAVAGWTAVGTLLLYLAHALWLAFGAFLVATWVLLFRFSWRELAARAAGALPVAVAALAWRETLTAGGWQSVMLMVISPQARVGKFEEFTTLLLGGLRGPAEKIFVAAALLWVLFGVWRARSTNSRAFDPFLLLTATLAAAVAIFAPDKVDRTVLFAWRWGPIALATILLAVAAPLRSPGRRALLAVALLLVLFVPTVTAWIGFEREEMAGFEPALAGIRPGASVLGLDYLRKSPRFRCDPYYQMFAYASVERGAAIQFSFAEVASSIVRYRAGAVDQPWTRELEVYPQLLAPGDYRHFDALLLHASPENAAELARGTGILGPVATSRQWQLLRVDRARAIELYHPLQSPSTAAEPAQ